MLRAATVAAVLPGLLTVISGQRIITQDGGIVLKPENGDVTVESGDVRVSLLATIAAVEATNVAQAELLTSQAVALETLRSQVCAASVHGGMGYRYPHAVIKPVTATALEDGRGNRCSHRSVG